MSSESAPLVRLGGDARDASIVEYNVPEPTRYSGAHILELALSPATFVASSGQGPGEPSTPPVGPVSGTQLRDAIVTGAAERFFPGMSRDRMTRILPQLLGMSGSETAGVWMMARRSPAVPSTGSIESRAFDHAVNESDGGAVLTLESLANRLQAGDRLTLVQTMYGDYKPIFMPPVPKARPRLVLLESYRLSTFLGRYGAGRTIKTLTLLPGEKTKISIKTYKKTESEAKSASSILDSFTRESADDFERAVGSETSDKRSETENFEYHAEAEASASWGFGSAKVSGGVRGGSTSAREEFAKNVSNATEKHASKASAKREVNVNTSFQVTESAGEETAVEREVENVNVSRTLNFVFRQMNQEFLTLLHLVDVRVGFFNGLPDSKIEVPLSRLDELLEEVVVAEERTAVRGAILAQVRSISDYRDHQHEDFVEFHSTDGTAEAVNGEAGYWRVSRTKEMEVDGHRVPGVVVAASRNVVRTDGVVAEAMLGQADALDDYSKGLQDEAVVEKQLENANRRLENSRIETALEILRAGDQERASLFPTLFRPPAEPSREVRS